MPPNPAASSHTGATVPRAPAGYHLDGVLGARVAWVRDANDRRRFLKRLDPRFADEPLARRQFANEVAILERLPAALAPRLLDHGADGRGPWLVLEALDGVDLRRVGVALPTAPLRRLLGHALEKLHLLHTTHDTEGPLAIVHGDLSPANLLLLRDGTLRLVDFDLGHARFLHLAHDGQFRGTLPYAAPEVVRGERASQASDVYALAACAAHLALGRAPRDETGPELLLHAGESAIEPPTLDDPTLNTALAEALASDPSRRPSALALRRALA